uniref:Related to SamB protein n=1 Tax=Melanopsichium pennsylvanicum 4 TaxID=1398559 RepID=A0A077R3D1_9BASI|nr:related to SamB protein [Melanopsichium pennsylvanicum 4]
MRESNFCNPAQNKASVCISSAVYDRRAIDCTATLPLINSLNHLAYLTSTSPRIREMVTLDGGLERLIRILRTVPKTPSPQVRAFSIKEMQAVWKWSLAFQCVVNIGVRGSESVRTRVVEAGMVPVTVRVLESYLRTMDRLKDERRKEALLHHQRQEARREDRPNRDGFEGSPTSHAHLAENDHTRRTHAAQDGRQDAGATSEPGRMEPTHYTAAQPLRNATNDRLLTETRPTTPLENPVSARRSSVFVGMDGQSGVDDFLPPQAPSMPVVQADTNHAAMPLIEGIDPLSLSSTGSAPSAGPHGTPQPLSTEQADGRGLAEVSSSEDLRSHAAEASGSGSDGAEDAEMFADEADDSEVDAIQSSATRSTDSMLTSSQNEAGNDDDLEERQTPRPARRALAPLSGQDSPPRPAQSYITPNRPTNAIAPPLFERQDTVRPSRDFSTASGSRDAASSTLASTALAAQIGSQNDTAPPAAHPAVVQLSNLADTNARNGIDVVYREEEVLLSLQLLAYLSKYAHVRILFHSSDFTGASLLGPLDALNEELEQAIKRNKSWDPSEAPRRNVFSIAEKFTLRSSRSNTYPSPRLSMEIQYWAGVIMRNACRKDESRGGIRQCANMLCGKWEEYPREFAKCRRCRKAKYCSKQCQSKGWQMGHRYWCSAKADESEAKDKEREKANELHRTGRLEDTDAAAPRIIPIAALTGGPAGFAADIPNEAADVLRDPGTRVAGRPEDIDGDDMDENAGARRRQISDTSRGSQSGLLSVSRSERRDGRSMLSTLGGPDADVDAIQDPRVHPCGSETPQQRAAFAGAESSTFGPNGGAGSRTAQPSGSSQMHRHVSSASFSVDVLSEQRHTARASEDDETWVGGAAGPGAPRLGMMPSPYADGPAAAESSAASWFASGRGDAGTNVQSAAVASNVCSPSRVSLNESPAPQDSRGARRNILPGSMGLPSTMLRQDLRDRRVTSLASLDTVDGSDVSEDETERRLAQTQGIHPAFTAAAVAAGMRPREGDAPPQAPQRTDLAGRPLPPPVIASQNGEEDELALGGRATPGVAGEQDFATGEIDQMLGHWATRRPGGIGLQHRVAEVRTETSSPERSLSPEASAYDESSEAIMGARSDDEDHGTTSRATRYAGLYGQAPFHPGFIRGQTPQPHHRGLHQQRSASGFSQFGSHGTRFGYGESMGETSTLQGYRPSMISSPLAQTPVRRTSGQHANEVLNGLEQAAQSLRHLSGSSSSSAVGAGYDSEDVVMMNDTASEQGRSNLAHSRLASYEDEVLDDGDNISMEL